MIVSIINNKGGTGKTTTCVNLATALAGKGHNVLLVDLDSQGSASLSMGIEYSDLRPSIAEVLFDGLDSRLAIRKSNIQNLSIITGDIQLASSDIILASTPGRENMLAQAMRNIINDYDFILYDCPPSLSMVSINALVASDYYLVPLNPQYLSLEGLISLTDAIEKIRAGIGINTELLGILFTMVSPARFLSLNPELKNQNKIMELVKEHYQDKVLHTVINRDLRLAEAPSTGSSIFKYAPGTKPAAQYNLLADEVLGKLKIN